jgi:mono/diheme cytochrome c family protein
MTRRMPHPAIISLAVVVALFSGRLRSRLTAAEPTPEQAKFFTEKVRPIFQQSCYSCHSHAAKKSRGGLMLDARDSILKGGDTGPAIVPDKPDDSLLLKSVRHLDDAPRMPPKGRLTDDQIATLAEWVKLGAPWPGGGEKVAGRPKAITDEDRKWWAFQPVRRPAVPEIRNPQSAIRNEIDAFVLARLQEAGLSPAPPADRAALIRRVTFDLTGLPPVPAEVEAFVNDPAADAYEKLVDRLLDSPRYGERWARHWLDLVRYAESDGFKADDYRPGAWRYRDYVVQSFNQDKPYDRFVKEQLAGDELWPDDPAAVVATGFLRAGTYEYNNRDAFTQWDNMLNDLTDTVGDVFLGTGVGCARCHDHKFDPILQRDYYRLQAFFAGLAAREDIPAYTARQEAEYRAKLREWEEKTADVRARIEALEAPMRAKAAKEAIAKFPEEIQAIIAKPEAKRTAYEQQVYELAYRQVKYEHDRLDRRFKDDAKKQLVMLYRELAKFDALKPPPLPDGYAARDVGPVAAPTVIPKKNGGGESIQPGVLTVLDERPMPIPPIEGRPTTGRRAALANWLTDRANPLATRVVVNRVWQYHFGQGLVPTASDFGKLGEKPSHPELLDWLADRFVRDGYRFKALHRLILTSRTYQQSATHPNPEAGKLKDPENRLLWRMPVRRLDAEQIRDSLLAVNGKLDLTAGGPSAEWAEPRRSVYTKVRRNTHDALLEAFDAPDAFFSTADRNTTTTPTQALLLINSPFMLAQARAFAERLRKEHPVDEARVEAAFRLAFGRPPTSLERAEALAFLAEQAKRINPKPDATASIQYGKVQYREGRAALVAPDSPMGKLQVPDSPHLPAGDFTAEAFITLRSLYEDGTVRPIVAHGTANKTPGWTFGVTSKKSQYKPQNLVLQIWGEDEKGTAYEPVFSNLHIDLNKPYFVAVTVKLGEPGSSSPRPAGEVTFYAKDLSNDDELMQVSKVSTKLVRLPSDRGPLTIGGGDDKAQERTWDGLIDDVRLSTGVLPVERFLLTAEAVTDRTCGFWRFESNPGFFQDSSGHGLHIAPAKPAAKKDAAPADPKLAALADFCHVLLNANEFLYVD